MPRQVTSLQVPVKTSILKFDLGSEEIHLTCAYERQQGPPIDRTGEQPAMAVVGRPGVQTTSPIGMRVGSWLIQGAMRDDEVREVRDALDRARRDQIPRDDIAVLEESVREVATIPAHDAIFRLTYPEQGAAIVAQVGCGDLTMNLGVCGYINNGLGQPPDQPIGPKLIALPTEPVSLRSYTALVKWKPRRPGEWPRTTIEEVMFARSSEAATMVHVRYDGRWLPRGDAIDFAMASRQVIRQGAVVPVQQTCLDHSDLRHLFVLPNVNPSGPLYPGEPAGGRGYRPRPFFGAMRHADVLLGEDALLGDENLRRAALAGPIYLDRRKALGGAVESQLEGALRLAGYRPATSPAQPLRPGEYRFIQLVRPTAQLPTLEIYLQRNIYSWTMLGLSADRRSLFHLACTVDRGRNAGLTLEAAAHLLLRAGAEDALLVDEGFDVFQYAALDSRGLLPIIAFQPPNLRRRLRATFIFVRRNGDADRPGQGGGGE